MNIYIKYSISFWKFLNKTLILSGFSTGLPGVRREGADLPLSVIMDNKICSRIII